MAFRSRVAATGSDRFQARHHNGARRCLHIRKGGIVFGVVRVAPPAAGAHPSYAGSQGLSGIFTGLGLQGLHGLIGFVAAQGLQGLAAVP